MNPFLFLTQAGVCNTLPLPKGYKASDSQADQKQARLKWEMTQARIEANRTNQPHDVYETNAEFCEYGFCRWLEPDYYARNDHMRPVVTMLPRDYFQTITL